MKPIDKKDMPKLIVLITLAVGVFGFLLKGLVFPGAATSAPPPPPPPAGGAPVAATTAGGGKAPAAGGALGAPAEDLAGVYDPTRVPFVPGGRDPFVPSGAAASTVVTAAPPLAPVPSLPGPVPSPTNQKVKDMLRVMAGSDNGPAPDSTVPPAPDEPGGGGVVVLPDPPAPDFQVTGVVLGEGGTRSVAILRGADNERRFVMVGDPVGAGFVVSAIHANGIDIQDPNGPTERVVTIKLGNTESSRAN